MVINTNIPETAANSAYSSFPCTNARLSFSVFVISNVRVGCLILIFTSLSYPGVNYTMQNKFSNF